MSAAISRAIKEALTEAIPLAAGVAAQTTANALPKQAAPVDGSHCNECGQLKRACRGEHRKVVVYPKQYGNDFPGVKINGAFYRSDHGSHMVVVPKDCNIENIVAGWEANEIVTRQGRQANHNSGSIGNGGGGFIPASTGWR